MADVKISQLPAATTPLDGTELTPIVQSGTTKRVSVANLTVGRALTASSLTLSTPLSAANGGTGITSLGTGIATFLGTPTSANLAAAVTDETGTGALVFGTSPTFTTSALFPAGTVGAPGISVSGDTNTGIYFPAADTIGFVEGGVEAMRLDASGNLGVGTTSPGYRLEVNSGSTAFATRVTTTSTLSLMAFGDSGTTGIGPYLGSAGNSLTFGRAGIAEYMRIDSSGNVGIGTSSPGAKLDVSSSASGAVSRYFYSGSTGGGAEIKVNNGFTSSSPVYGFWYNNNTGIGNPAANVISFITNTSESARIDASGNLLVGTASSSGTRGGGKLLVDAANGTTPIAAFTNTTSGNAYVIATSLESAANNTSSFHLRSTTQSVGTWYLYGNGSSSFSSDERLKKDIQTARDGYLDDLMKLRVVKYRWHNQDEDTPQELGFIAQEMEQVFPGLVIEHELEGAGVRKNIKHSVMEFILTKAIQELAAKVSALEAKQ